MNVGPIGIGICYPFRSCGVSAMVGMIHLPDGRGLNVDAVWLSLAVFNPQKISPSTLSRGFERLATKPLLQEPSAWVCLPTQQAILQG